MFSSRVNKISTLMIKITEHDLHMCMTPFHKILNEKNHLVYNWNKEREYSCNKWIGNEMISIQYCCDRANRRLQIMHLLKPRMITGLNYTERLLCLDIDIWDINIKNHKKTNEHQNIAIKSYRKTIASQNIDVQKSFRKAFR